MGLIFQIKSMFAGLAEFMSLWRDFFGLLPLPVQILVYFAFGSFLLLGIIQMLRSR